MEAQGKLRWISTIAFVAAAVAPSFAEAAFDPSMKFSPASRVAGANPKLAVTIAQDPGEDPIDKVTFLIPGRFGFPTDASLAHGEVLGTGQYKTALGPLCIPSLQHTFEATANERNRTAEEAATKVWVVWVIDLGAVQVDLVFSRVRRGWRAEADVPSSPAVCAPGTLSAALTETSTTSHTRLWRNPRRPGLYTLKSIFTSTTGVEHVVTQRMRILRRRPAERPVTSRAGGREQR